MWISWRSFMCEIMVRGWVVVTSSSHIPYCTPIHRYTLLLALWASRGLLWPFLSFSLAYLFFTRVGGLPLCALYLLIGSMSIVGMVLFFVCSFLHHCLFLFVSILHLHTVFISLLFSLLWWWRALISRLQVRLVTSFVPPLGFDPGVLVWGDHLGLRFEVLLVGLC